MTSLPTWRRWTLLRPRRPHSGDVGRCCGRDGRAAGRVPVPGTAALRKSGPEVADDELTNLATLDIAAAETAALRGTFGRCCGRDGRTPGGVPVPGTAALRKSGPEVADDELTNLATLDIAAAETAALRGRWTLLWPGRLRSMAYCVPALAFNMLITSVASFFCFSLRLGLAAIFSKPAMASWVLP